MSQNGRLLFVCAISLLLITIKNVFSCLKDNNTLSFVAINKKNDLNYKGRGDSLCLK